MFTVTVPPGAIVTAPVNTPLAFRLNVAVLALPLLFTLLEMRASVLVNWLGRLSLSVPLNVPGPVLPTTKVKLVVPFITKLFEPTALVTPTVTVGITLITAETVEELVPTDVVKEPGAMVLVTVPPTELVTTTEMVQVDA